MRGLVGTAGRRLAGFSLVWVIFFGVVLSLFPGKRSIYSFLFHAPIFILIGQAMAAGVSGKSGRIARVWSLFVLSLVAAIMVILATTMGTAGATESSFRFLLDFVQERYGSDPQSALASIGLPMPGDADFVAFRHDLRVIALPFALGAIFLLVDLFRRRLDRGADLATIGFALGLSFLCSQGLPWADPGRSRRDLAEAVTAEIGAEPVAIYRHLDEGLLYYLGRTIPELSGDEGTIDPKAPEDERIAAARAAADAAALAWLNDPGHRYLVVRQEDREHFGKELADRPHRVVFSRRVGSNRAYELLDFAPEEVPVPDESR